jgi:rare lipoprotein A
MRAVAALRLVLGLASLATLAACGGGGGAAGPLHNRESAAIPQHGYYKVGDPYTIDGVTYVPAVDYHYDETGIASWYGPDFDGKFTANGELYDMNQVTAAHKTLPMPSLCRVTNLDNGRQIIVRVNDRGPYARGRIMDMSRRAAQLLGFEKGGTAKVRVQIMAQESMALAEAAKQGQLAVNIAGIDPETAPPLPEGTPSYVKPGQAQPESQPAQYQPPQYQPQYQPNAQPAYRPPPVRMAENQEPPPPAWAAQPQKEPPRPPDVAVVDEKAMIERAEPGKKLKGQDIAGLYMPPTTVVAYKPVKPTGIYIQAGAFGVAANAQKLSARLGAVGHTDVSTAIINGQTFYRVRVGPVASVDEADRLLTRVVNAGGAGAKIVVN